MTVEKIECRNHLLRNYLLKVRSQSEQTKVGTSTLRKLIGGKSLKFRGAVTEAIKYRSKEKVDTKEKVVNLKNYIENGPNHVLGEHSNCAPYFCTGSKENEINLVPQVKASGLYQQLMVAVRYLANNPRSLIYDVDSNSVEQFNSIVAKFVGGKRINYSLKRSYQG